MNSLKSLLLILYLTSPLFAQNYNFVSYKERGFSNNQVFSIYQDYHGFLWIGTGVGLARYDSEQYLYFSVEDSLPANEILSLASDGSSTLWIGTGLGLAAFDIEDVNTPRFKFTPHELLKEPISSLLFNKGKLWIGTDNGLFIYEEYGVNNYKITNYNKDYHAKDIKLSKQGNIVILYENTVIVYDNNRNILHKSELLLDARLSCLLPQSETNVLIGTDEGLIDLSLQTDKWELVYKSKTSHLDFKQFIVDQENTIWAGVDKGLLKITKNDIQLIDKNKGLRGNDIRALLFDKEGNLWTGSYIAGLYKLSNPDLLNYNESNGLLSNAVNCIIQENENTKLIGTDLGILRLDCLKLSPDNRLKE